MSYIVHATIRVPAWYEVEADTPEAALMKAQDALASDFELDMLAAQVIYEVPPWVEVA